MVIIPPPRSSNPRPQQMNYIKAVTSLPCTLSDDNLIMIFQTVGDHERGRLRRLFVVLDDDAHDQCLSLVKEFHEKRRRGGRQDAALSFSGTVSGPGLGMEVSDTLIQSLRQPPPPPPPSSVDPVSEDKVSSGGLKRSRQSESPQHDRKRARSSSSSSSASSSSSGSSSSSSSGTRHRHSKKSKSRGKTRGKGKSKSKNRKHRR